MTKIVGLDLSMTSTGLATISKRGVSVDRIRTQKTSADLIARRDRLRDIRVGVVEWISGAHLAVIEGLAYASQSPHATERAGLWWLVVDRIIAHHIPVAVVTPTARAKYATGNGRAGKDEVLAAVVRRYPEVDVRGNDEADALTLAAMGARHLGQPIDDLPKLNLEAMEKVAWPKEES